MDNDTLSFQSPLHESDNDLSLSLTINVEDSTNESGLDGASKDDQIDSSTSKVDHSTYFPSSPNAISEAALAQAMKDRKKSRSSWSDDMTSNEDTTDLKNNNVIAPAVLNSFDHNHKKQKTNHNDNSHNTSHNDGALEEINNIWKSTESNDDDSANSLGNVNKKHFDPAFLHNALEKTKQIAYQQLDSIIKSGLEIFHKNDALKRELVQAKELCESRNREIQRLKASEVDTRASLSVSRNDCYIRAFHIHA